MSVNMSVEF